MKSIHVSKFASTFQIAALAIVLMAAQFVLGRQGSQSLPGMGTAYLTHVTTDKPIYRAGERLYVRGVLLRAEDHTPMDGTGTASILIKGPKGEVVSSTSAAIAESVAAFSWDIPAGQAGGEYTISISHPWSDAPGERKFDIRAYRAPRLKSQIVFVRDGYGPGDKVAARLHVERAEGGFPEGAKVGISARIDGKEAWTGETKVDRSGNAEVTFKLPATITRGEGVLALAIQDGGTVETAAKTIPILLHTVDVSMFPEGGDLIAGLENRVYIEGRTTARKPADMAGSVIDASGREIAMFRTEHEGRGRFSFVPVKGETYSLRLSEPAGISKSFPLPAVKETGVVLTFLSDVTSRLDDVAVRVAASTAGAYDVALTQRGKELASKRVTLNASQPASVSLTLPKSVDGVIAVTVFDAARKPLAERLIFRQPDRRLNIRVSTEHNDYVPGDRVTLRLATSDETGKPISATVGLAVTDSSVLEMIDKREQAPRLPVMVLFESDVRDLADAHVYLDETNPKAGLATDLLLGTQGWRRFATVDITKFIASHGDVARRALALRTRAPSWGRIAPPVVPPFPEQPLPPVPAPAYIAGVGTGNEYISGTVADASMALIPGVTVNAMNAVTGQSVTVITNESGTYSIPRLAVGMYELSASLPGFRTSRVRALPLAEGGAVRQDFVLQIGAVNTMVEVTAVADMMMTVSSASVGQVLPARQIRDLPLVGNDVLNIARVMNPDLVGEIRLVVSPVDAELGRGNGAIAVGTRPNNRPNALTVREYAHTLQQNQGGNSRADFSETVYWNAAVKTDAAGKATVTFGLSDSVTSFRVHADGFTPDGALGSSVSHIESVQPFSIEPKLPLQVTSGDVIQLPVGLINGTNSELRNTEFRLPGADGLKLTPLDANEIVLRPKERLRRLVEIEVSPEISGLRNLTIDASAGRYRDSVRRDLDVQPVGFPHEVTAAGSLERNGTQSFEFTLPADTVRGSVSSNTTVYPTPLATMTDALKALIREPSGCFEQTSSTSYPMVMAQQYFLTHTGVEPALIERTRSLLDGAYKKLLGFQSRSHGFEWFGSDPGHEALTAYGLMQFTDMAQVRNVDKDMLDRTRTWLLSRRDGEGSFKVNPNALDSFGRAPKVTTDAYIVWALTEAGEKGLEREISAIKANASSTGDSYVIALAANVLHSTGDRAGARLLMDKLARKQEISGSVQGADTSITRSGGAALTIETTALSVLAWMKEGSFSTNAARGLRWILESNKGGRFGSTQSTILALRSIIAHDVANAGPKASGQVQLVIDGKPVGKPTAFTANTQGALVLPDLGRELGPGKHSVVLKMEDGSKLPFSFTVRYHGVLPANSEEAQVAIQVALRDPQVREGDVTEAAVSVSNKSDQAVPTPVAIIGIPGGLEVRHDQLKELVKAGRIAAYEVMGREVVLYWRYIKAKETVELPLSLVAAVPGTYTAPASRAYLYYTDEYKNWAPGVKVSITPR